MGKGKRLKEKRKLGGFLEHSRDIFTREFQKQIRGSEFWPQMVAEFGEKKAEELLKQCKGEFRPGVPPDEVGNSSTDI